jgi:hypothetical protein
MYSHTTGVITPVLQPLQALDQHRNNISVRNGAHNATHIYLPLSANSLGKASGENTAKIP